MSWGAQVSWSLLHVNFITSQRSHFQISSHWWLGLQQRNFRETQVFHPSQRARKECSCFHPLNGNDMRPHRKGNTLCCLSHWLLPPLSDLCLLISLKTLFAWFSVVVIQIKVFLAWLNVHGTMVFRFLPSPKRISFRKFHKQYVSNFLIFG